MCIETLLNIVSKAHIMNAKNIHIDKKGPKNDKKIPQQNICIAKTKRNESEMDDVPKLNFQNPNIMMTQEMLHIKWQLHHNISYIVS